MSYQQLETRLKALQGEQMRLREEYFQAVGARRELIFAQEQMVPGIDHEIMEDRRKKMENNMVRLSDALQEITGKIQETAYWLHQTMAGQPPAEAIEQIRRFEDGLRRADGPMTDLEELQYRSVNGAGELIALETA